MTAIPVLLHYSQDAQTVVVGEGAAATGRRWLSASFAGSVTITGYVLWQMIIDNEFDDIRGHNRFKKLYAPGIIIVMIGLIIGAIIFCFYSPNAVDTWIRHYSRGGVSAAELLALFSALVVFWLDWMLLKALDTKSSLRKRHLITVYLIDFPLAIAIIFILFFAEMYSIIWPMESPHSTVNFVYGFSSGAVAVELYFANIIFWINIKKIAES